MLIGEVKMAERSFVQEVQNYGKGKVKPSVVKGSLLLQKRY